MKSLTSGKTGDYKKLENQLKKGESGIFKKVLCLMAVLCMFSFVGFTKTSLHDKLVGNWKVDIEETKNQNPEKDINNPFTKSILSSMKFEFKKDIQNITIGEETKDTSYKVIKQEGDMLLIKNEYGEKSSIQFLNDDKIKIMEKGKDMDIIFNRQ